jgi:hypothetical protein
MGGLARDLSFKAQAKYLASAQNYHSRSRRDSWSGPRQRSVAASMYSAASALDIIRKSNDNLAELGDATLPP